MVTNIYANFNCITNDSINYSIDMLRLTTRLTVEQFSIIEFRLKAVYGQFLDNEYISNSISTFKQNYVVKLEENCSYWLGFQSNSELLLNVYTV
jgi:hypothetical protein